MDMFTDVDILYDILTAAKRNVAVYILLDEQNVHHFVNMLFNCRVNLQSFQVSTDNLKKQIKISIYYWKVEDRSIMWLQLEIFQEQLWQNHMPPFLYQHMQ